MYTNTNQTQIQNKEVVYPENAEQKEEPEEEQQPVYSENVEEEQEFSNEIESSSEDCVYEIGKDNIITKIERNNESLKHRIKISNKMRDFFKTHSKYEPHFLYMLEDPMSSTTNQISFSEIKENKNLEKCQLSENSETPEYYLCKYKKIETIPIERYIQENPIIQTITDIHNLLLESISELCKNTKIVNITINEDTVNMITQIGIPIITNYSNAFDSSELTLETLNERIPNSPDETKCLEMQILFHIGDKMQLISQNDSTPLIFTELDMNQVYSRINPSYHPSQQQMQEEYLNKTYEEVYEKTRESIDSWDIYALTYMFWKIITNIQELQIQIPLIPKYKMVLEEFLVKMPKDRSNFRTMFERIAESEIQPEIQTEMQNININNNNNPETQSNIF